MSNPSDPSGLMVCPDGHRCENYSICVENDEDEGNYYCDCDATTVNSAFRGLYCEHEATTFCSDDASITKTSFCTNGGTCVAVVGENEAHLGCECPPEYEGTHCQFVKGTAPDNWGGNPNYGRSYSDGGGINPGAIAAIVIIVIVVMVAAGLFARRSHLRTQQGKEEVEVGSSVDGLDSVVTDDDLHLDADGGVLQEAVADSTKHTDEMANEEDDGAMEGEIL